MDYCIDFASIGSRQDFHRTLAHVLSFPEWYGSNLDALYDCLTELDTPVHLVLRGWNDEGDFAPGFKAVFLDAQLENPDFSVSFE